MTDEAENSRKRSGGARARRRSPEKDRPATIRDVAAKAGVSVATVSRALAGTVAVGALAALREAGLRVPRDVSLVGFDDVPFATDQTPPLITVRVPYGELGRSAVRPALEREERVAVGDHLVLSTRLVIRQSVRRVG